MTEKRFTESIYGITDNQTNIQYGWREADLGIMKLCELLNNLNQEISDLKKWLSTVPQLENRISKLNDENEQLKQQIAELQYSKKMLRITNKDLELGIRRLRKSFDDFDKMRVEHIRFLQKRMKKYGISIYYNDGDDE